MRQYWIENFPILSDENQTDQFYMEVYGPFVPENFGIRLREEKYVGMR